MVPPLAWSASETEDYSAGIQRWFAGASHIGSPLILIVILNISESILQLNVAMLCKISQQISPSAVKLNIHAFN